MHESVLAELEEVIRTGSSEKRIGTLRKVTNLFLNDHDRFNDAQVHVFDEVLMRLIARAETRALAELSRRLAPIPNAPPEVIGTLARDEDSSVAAPVLAQSQRLSNEDLIEIATSKGHGHLMAIASRDQLEVPVTEVLVQQGDREVIDRLVKNSGASFSENSFVSLVDRAEEDEGLALQLGRRLDVPLRIFRELLLRTTEAVRRKLLAISAGNEAEIQNVLADMYAEIAKQTAAVVRDYTTAKHLAQLLKERGELNQDAILTMLRANKYEELVAALSLLCGLPIEMIERLMNAPRNEAILIPCKAAGLDWATTRAILKNRPMAKQSSGEELDRAWGEYIKLSQETARRVVRFWQVRETVKGDPSEPEPASAA